MVLPKYIASFSGNSGKVETSNSRFYISVAYLLLGFILAFVSYGKHFMGSYPMFYFFGMGLAGIISYHLYSKNTQIGITFYSDSLRIQPKMFNKKTIPLTDIVSIEIHLAVVILHLKNNLHEKIEVSNFSFSAVKELKESLKEYADQNKIECIIN